MRFDPMITKVKLNPEQAVLACDCVLGRYVMTNINTKASLCTSRGLVTSRSARSTKYCTAGTQNNTT